MIFSQKNIIDILLSNECKPEIIITTSKSCYKGRTYKIDCGLWRDAVQIKRNGRYVYYFAGSYKLTEKTYEMFKNLKVPAVDFFKKNIIEEDILFTNGRLFKVIKITNKFTYVKIVATSDFWDKFADFNEWLEDRIYNEDEEILQLETPELCTFIKIDDPLDLLSV